MSSKKRKKNRLNQIFLQNQKTILSGILGQQTKQQVDSAIFFARYLSSVGIDRTNYKLFLYILETNNHWVVNALIGKRKPRLLFTPIKPNRYLIQRAFQLLTFWHPGEIIPKTLLAVLGIIEYSYHKADDGYAICKLSINMLNNIGKYLEKDQDQDHEINCIILEILDRMTRLGEYRAQIHKSTIAKHAFDIRIAYFDHTKKLVDIIPEVLLVHLDRKDEETKPSKKILKIL